MATQIKQFNEVINFTRGTGATRINNAGLIVGVDFSTSSVVFGTGSKTFTLAADANVNRDWPVGSSVRAASQAAPLGEMVGTVVSYDPVTQALVINVATSTGTGTGTNWRIGSLEVRRDAKGILQEPTATNSVTNSDNRLATSGFTITTRPSIDGISRNLYTETTGTVTAGISAQITSPQNSDSWGPSVGVPLIINVRTHTITQGGTNSTIESIGGGFYRVRAFSPTNTTIPRSHLEFVYWSNTTEDRFLGLVHINTSLWTFRYSNSTAANVGNNFTGNGTSQIMVVAVQETIGAFSSYIPTTTIAVTRAADSFAGTALTVNSLRQGEGTLYVEAETADAGVDQKRALLLSGSTGDIRLAKRGNQVQSFTKMAEGGGRIMIGTSVGNSKTDTGKNTSDIVAALDDRTGVSATVGIANAFAFNGTDEFGYLLTNAEAQIKSNLGQLFTRGLGAVSLGSAHHNGTSFLIPTAVAGIVVKSDGVNYRRINTPVITQPTNEITSGLVGATLRNVIVGAAGFIATSDDNGETWTARTSGVAVSLNGVTKSTSYFVCTVTSGQARYSADGITWLATTGYNISGLDIHANGNLVVSVGNAGAILVSTDGGATWTPSASSGVTTTQNLSGITYNATANLWVACGAAGTVITATDPAGTWTLYNNTTTPSTGNTQNLNEVIYHGTKFYSVGNGGTVTIFDPVAISFSTFNNPASIANHNLSGVGSAGGTLLLLGQNNTFVASTLANPTVAADFTSRTSNNATINSIAFGAGKYVSAGVAINGSAYIATIDPDGTVTRRVSGTVQIMNQVRFLRNAFYAIANNSILSRSALGDTWATQTLGGTGFNLNDIADSGSLMIAVGSGGRYSTSADGLTFANSALNGQTTQQLNGIDHFGGTFVIVGNAGVILTTTNGTTYTLRTSGTTQNLTSVIYSTLYGAWLVAGANGTMLASYDNGVTWRSIGGSSFGAIDNSGIQANPIGAQWKTGLNTLALSYKGNRVNFAINGEKAQEDTLSTIPSITSMLFGDNFNGYIKKFKLYPRSYDTNNTLRISAGLEPLDENLQYELGANSNDSLAVDAINNTLGVK